MRIMTSEQFRQAVELDPTWAVNLNEPVKITDYCDMAGSGVANLSPQLHFTGRNEEGDSADFSECANLKVAEGSFAGRVNFSGSGVAKIGDLHISSPSTDGMAAIFFGCENLKVAEGNFPGFVIFSDSGVVRIGDLHISSPKMDGIAAFFCDCQSLKVAEGTFPGGVWFCGSGIERIGELVIIRPDNAGIAADFDRCKGLKTAEGTFPGSVSFRHSGITKSAISSSSRATIGATLPISTAAKALKWPKARSPALSTSLHPESIQLAIWS